LVLKAGGQDDSRIEGISWEEFQKTLKKRKLAVYKAENSDFLKIMRDT